MRIEASLAQYLTEHPGMSTVVGDRIYPRRLPQEPELPAITYSLISNVRRRDLADVAYYQARVQFSCWGSAYGDTKRMADALADAMEGFTGQLYGLYVLKAEIDNENDEGEEELDLHHSPVDVLITYRGGS